MWVTNKVREQVADPAQKMNWTENEASLEKGKVKNRPKCKLLYLYIGYV